MGPMMQPIQQDFAVRYRYSVAFTEHLFDPENPILRDALNRPPNAGPVRVLFVLDDGVVEHHPALIDAITAYTHAHEDAFHPPGTPIIVPGGEACKNDAYHVDRVREAVAREGICRHSFVIAIGGGAVLDMAGFAAATSHRGVRLIRIPTTVLAQNDSGIGVKNGINAFDSKNFLGSFAPPWAVLNDFTFLSTLNDRDWRGGISEALKVALIKDAAFFEFIEEKAAQLAPPQREAAPMHKLIHVCAQMHADHIAKGGDPFEGGSSRPLDFGHWAAHKLESLTQYSLRHGEAVAIGIVLDATYSMLDGRLSQAKWERIVQVFETLGFRLFDDALTSRLDEPDHPDSLFHGIQEFREHLGGILTIMLLDDIGTGVEVHEVDLNRYQEAIHLMRERAGVPAT